MVIFISKYFATLKDDKASQQKKSEKDASYFTCAERSYLSKFNLSFRSRKVGVLQNRNDLGMGGSSRFLPFFLFKVKLESGVKWIFFVGFLQKRTD